MSGGNENYEPYITVQTRGYGDVGLMTCKRCGAVVMLDKAETPRLHDKWHEEKEEAPR